MKANWTLPEPLQTDQWQAEARNRRGMWKKEEPHVSQVCIIGGPTEVEKAKAATIFIIILFHLEERLPRGADIFLWIFEKKFVFHVALRFHKHS